MRKKKVYLAELNSGVRFASGFRDNLSYAKNVIFHEGVVKKRNGWRVLYNFRGYDYEPYAINGIYEYKGREKSCLIVHADCHMYECSYDLREIREIPQGNGVEFKNQRSCGQMFGGLLWIGGMEQVLIYDGEAVRTAQSHSKCYVPITTTGITDYELAGEGKTCESPNVISGKRINLLKGVKNGNGSHKFMLDSGVLYGKPFRVKASFRVKKSGEAEDSYTSIHTGKDLEGNDVNAVVTVEFSTDNLSGKLNNFSHPVDGYGRKVVIEDANLTCQVIDGRELAFNFDVVSYNRNVDNIEVEFTTENQIGTDLGGCGCMCEVPFKSGESALVIATGTGQLFFNMSKKDKIYFPQSMITNVGSEAKKITALLPMSKSTLAIYKENEFYVLRLDTENGHRLFAGADSQGCLNPFVATHFGNDILALNIDGICGAVDSGSEDVVYTRQYIRSESIQRELDKTPIETLEKASACVHKGLYYLFVGDIAYVARSKENKSYEYDWWIFDNCSARVSASINGNLYMGREKGEVAIFDQEYKDRQNYVLTERERDFVFHQGEITKASFNYAVKVGTGTKISLDSHYSKWSDCYFDHDTNQIHIPREYCYDESKYIGPCVDDSVLLIDTEGYIVYEGEVRDFDPYQCTIYCTHLGLGKSTSLSLYIKRHEKTEYTLALVDGEYALFLGKHPVTLYSTEIDRVYVTKSAEIECELYTPITNLGTQENKNLVGICVTPSEDTKSNMEIGYETGIGKYAREVTVGSYMSFDGLNFNNLSFNPRFKRSIKINCLERNFDYIRLYVRSTRGESFGVEELSLTYN